MEDKVEARQRYVMYAIIAGSVLLITIILLTTTNGGGGAVVGDAPAQTTPTIVPPAEGAA